MDTFNIAMMAHVDAGKTTLTERLLYDAGVIRTLGSVDDGTARTDDLTVERARGISVRSAVTSLETGGVTVNIIDTPGHADFYTQVERAFLAADAVVVLISAPDGIQAGTETIISEAESKRVPVIFFVNKCDRAFTPPARPEEIHAGAYAWPEDRYETAALFDDGVADAFLSGRPEDVSVTDPILREAFHSRKAHPVIYGSAQTGEGVDRLLDVFARLAPRGGGGSGEAAGVIFSVTHDKMFGRGAYIRLYSGELRVRESVSLGGGTYKAAIVKKLVNGRWVDGKSLCQGDIGLVFGLSNCKTGDFFGGETCLPLRAVCGLTHKALLTAKIGGAEDRVIRAALEMMTAEDPALVFETDPFSGAMHINVMGSVQMETLPALIEERFGLQVVLGEPEIIYKETPAKEAYGFDAYTMPKPCWAVLKFKLTPGERGSGVTYRCSAGADRLPYRYREQVALSVAPSLKQGPYGWEVTDVDIELVDGQDHHIHTHPLDFTIATPLALADGLRNSGTVLLEPILDITFTCSAKHLGRIMSDVTRMRGQSGEPVYRGGGGDVTLCARVPLAASLTYPVTFASITSGLGVMTQKFYGYGECPLELGKTRPRRGVDPLDRSRYILAARNAMTGTVFS
ncbi:MAG: TetM/TetW/TetO/TetS family tetracycline resistance ribosomal protection protein [Oscillospiraceae bacterium]|jgi:ribosomal protection tetracycline resistance protein|nr:TetM/TetW/TetO/TetS family tetracycline resistance ribosomal protection protein [Oscillospiraceae bacterium]